MKKSGVRFLALLLALSCLLCPLCVGAADGGKTYYVDAANGSDENEGTADSPWQTFAPLENTALSAGDSVLLHRGQVFPFSFVPGASGSEEAPITLGAYGEGEKPLIKLDVTGFPVLLLNVSHWIVTDIAVSSPEGGGMYIMAIGDGQTVSDITVQNCDFFDIALNTTNTMCAAINIDANGYRAAVNDIHFDNITINHAAWGIHTAGMNRERDINTFESPELTYNHNFLFENIQVNDARCGGIVIGAVQDALVRGCRMTNCATLEGEPYAALWMHHSDRVRVEYCEISGTSNTWDGMALDFDGWTTNSTYDHIYSHNNHCFMKNCVFDAETRNKGNTVSNCVSVDDGGDINWAAIPLFSTDVPSFSPMFHFTFENNILVNDKPILWLFTPFAAVRNNTFAGNTVSLLLHRLFNLFTFGARQNYVSSDSPVIAERIAEITAELPAPFTEING